MNATFRRWRILLQNTPIKRRLTLMMLATSTAALLIACAAFAFNEVVTFRRDIARNLAILADVLSINSTAALTFSDKGDARDNLAALNAAPHVLAAALYDANGGLFASYLRQDLSEPLPPHPEANGSRFEHGRFVLFHPIYLEGKRIGTIYLEAGLEEVYADLRFYGLVAVAVLLGSLIIALGVSSLLQRFISQPLFTLADTARDVAKNRDYSVRALKEGEDEIGLLTDAFNQMLATIQERDSDLSHSNSDLTEQIRARVQAEDELRQLNDELEGRVEARTRELKRSNEELEQFAYVASHDLQEPLRMVISFMQLLERKYKGRLDGDADTYIGFAVDGAKRMQSLIRDLLTYSRVGTRPLEFQLVDLNTVLQQVTADLQLAIEAAGARVTWATMPAVMGDPIQLSQIFQNLISNGIKFHGPDTPVIEIKAVEVEHGWELTVHDNGIGIEKEFFDRIFVIFQRLHSVQKYAGTGIGLAVCKKIIERHGGTIWVESQPGQGTIFHFTLPRAGQSHQDAV